MGRGKYRSSLAHLLIEKVKVGEITAYDETPEDYFTEVITPEENMGDVVADLNKRRGLIEGMDNKNGAKVVKAKVPLSEMFGYVTSLRTITSGRATSTMEFSHFAEAPQAVSKEVIAKAKGQVEA